MIQRFLKIFCICLFLVSCGEKEQEEKNASSGLELVKADFSDLKGWKNDRLSDIVPAIEKSCSKIITQKSEFLGSAEIKIPTKSYTDICLKLLKNPKTDIKKFIKSNFTPYLVKFNNSSQGKFTSYYEAELHASKTPDEKYRYPIYGRPNDIIEINLHDFDKNLPNKRYVGRIENQKLVPYYTRSEIENNGIDAPVILWSDSYIDIYIMQIQGSAVATLTDGSKVRIGYAENNGRDFKGIGSILLEKGLLKPGQTSMSHIKKWLKENIDASTVHMNENNRYVFHRLIQSPGPIGAQGVPLTAGRSLAVDKAYIPLGALLWLETSGPDRQPINKMVVAQDIGGAIKGAVRGDYFWGSGGDDILDLAGKMNSAGQYYILLPKNMEIKQ